MKTRHAIAALATISIVPLTASSCMPTPGWEGKGTIIEIEYVNPEAEGSGIDADGLEITVITEAGPEDNAMFAPTDDCADAFRVGQTITLDQASNACGDPGWSSDD